MREPTNWHDHRPTLPEPEPFYEVQKFSVERALQLWETRKIERY